MALKRPIENSSEEIAKKKLRTKLDHDLSLLWEKIDMSTGEQKQLAIETFAGVVQASIHETKTPIKDLPPCVARTIQQPNFEQIQPLVHGTAVLRSISYECCMQPIQNNILKDERLIFNPNLQKKITIRYPKNRYENLESWEVKYDVVEIATVCKFIVELKSFYKSSIDKEDLLQISKQCDKNAALLAIRALETGRPLQKYKIRETCMWFEGLRKIDDNLYEVVFGS